eukprot:GHVP01018565.1.p1 GENE.GHVP01018565.1~~GHVP01018565.1.p1  ORF type:complete len:260 (+),score=75.62 GHVP01018565.1:1635-2414(+)
MENIQGPDNFFEGFSLENQVFPKTKISQSDPFSKRIEEIAKSLSIDQNYPKSLENGVSKFQKNKRKKRKEDDEFVPSGYKLNSKKQKIPKKPKKVSEERPKKNSPQQRPKRSCVMKGNYWSEVLLDEDFDLIEASPIQRKVENKSRQSTASADPTTANSHSRMSECSSSADVPQTEVSQPAEEECSKIPQGECSTVPQEECSSIAEANFFSIPEFGLVDDANIAPSTSLPTVHPVVQTSKQSEQESIENRCSTKSSKQS